jgi:hypothetical protein
MPRHARAFRQGDLDGLCGVYAVVNALRYLFGLKEDHCRALFAALIKALHRSRRPHHPILWGMSFATLKRLIEAAQTCKVLDGAQTFQARPLRLSRDQRNLPQLWSGLSQELTPTCVAIVGLGGVPTTGALSSGSRRKPFTFSTHRDKREFTGPGARFGPVGPATALKRARSS